MGDAAEWQLAGDMARGMRGSGFPRGWNSERRPCPDCGKPVGGRETGMADHLRSAHAYPRARAVTRVRESGITWSTEDEIRARTPATPKETDHG